MNVEFYFHGVPSAFQEWSTEKSEKNSLIRFYTKDAIEEQTRFVIELSVIANTTGNVLCAYYTLLKKKKFFDNTGREGSYFGLTIRFDEEYCLDVEKVYSICESIYENDICGKIVKKEGDSIIYLVQNFDAQSSYLKQISDKMAKSISCLRYSNIKNDLIENTGTKVAPKYVNLSEASGELFWSNLKKTQKIFVSTEYPVKDNTIEKLRQQLESEQEKNNTLQKKNKSLELQVSQNSGELDVCRKNIDTLQKELQDAKARLEVYEGKSNKLKKEFTQSLRAIEEPIKKLASVFNSFTSEEDGSEIEMPCKRGNKKRLKSYLVSASFFVNLSVLLAVIFLVLLQTSVVKLNDSITNEIQSDKVEIVKENSILDSLQTDTIGQVSDSIK